MKFSIYHPTGGRLNTECLPKAFMYEHICTIDASSFAEAFRLTQNDWDEEYRRIGVRSTSVGDIIQSDNDQRHGACHLIEGNGFKQISDDWLHFIDWKETDDIMLEHELKQEYTHK